MASWVFFPASGAKGSFVALFAVRVALSAVAAVVQIVAFRAIAAPLARSLELLERCGKLVSRNLTAAIAVQYTPKKRCVLPGQVDGLRESIELLLVHDSVGAGEAVELAANSLGEFEHVGNNCITLQAILAILAF